jgi:hypothetical protein
MLPRQIRSVVQWVQGESQGKQPNLEPSTPYPGSTSAPGNTGTLYPGNSSASGNPGNIASTSTLHPGNTSGNVIYTDASLPYLGGVSMENPGNFPTANLSYLRSASTSGNSGFPAHTTPANPNPNSWGFRVPDLAKFTGDDAKTTYEHIGQFLAQVNDVGITDVHNIGRSSFCRFDTISQG